MRSAFRKSLRNDEQTMPFAIEDPQKRTAVNETDEKAYPGLIERYRQGESNPGAVDGQLAGKPLGGETQAAMQRTFRGYDLSRVRIHEDSRANQAVGRSGNDAVTVGNNIFLGQHAYKPTTARGGEVLAHEISHTLHQQGAESQGAPTPGRSAAGLEAEASQAAYQFATGQAISGGLSTGAIGPCVQPLHSESGSDAPEIDVDRAVAYNNRKHSGAARSAILRFLASRNPALPASGEFTEAHVRYVAKLQSDAKLAKKAIDGMIGSTTLGLLRSQGYDPGDTGVSADGAAGPGNEITDSKIKKALSWNSDTWTGDRRQSLLTYLNKINSSLSGTADFTPQHIQFLMQLQGEAKQTSDGMVGNKTVAILMAGGYQPVAGQGQLKGKDVVIKFYPGELSTPDSALRDSTPGDKDGPETDPRLDPKKAAMGRLYVFANGRLEGIYLARGGPEFRYPDRGHSADPTPAGTYKLGATHHKTTSNWYYSQIPWAAKIREKDSQIQYQPEGTTRWLWATGPASTLKAPMQRSDFLDNGQLVSTYEKNDFGKWAWNMRSVKGGKATQTPFYIHTSPYEEKLTEQGGDPQLTSSHGCVHIKPADRDVMMARGYLQKDVTFIVYKYDVKYL